MELARFDPEPCGFPRPRLSPLPDKPDLTARNWRSVILSYRARRHYRHFTRGRYALGEAYRLSDVSRDGALFAPAYHCVTMLDPAMALKADILLYPLQPDLSPDLAKLDELLTAYDKPVKALLATHFFGFAKNFSNLKHWCDEHRIVLIEDCSHALFTEAFQAPGTGIFGRFVSASPYKFFACEDGGLLFSPDAQPLDTVNTRSAGLLPELRGIKRTIERSRLSGPTAADIDLIGARLAKLSARPPVAGYEQIMPYSQPSSLYWAEESGRASLFGSRCIVRLSSIGDNMNRRRSNYLRWANAIADLPDCHALFPDLPEDCFPYMFPLHIAHPDPYFYWLKHLGVPVWRWDEMAVSNCQVANEYRHHLLHLACHQSLTDQQMNWMIATVQKTLRLPFPGDR
ncbi:MAG: DegT/DnrJ/EryC1/StrS aminotransferase family protein [Propionivibrio sp.]|nr:DegT/DnrJ/EryC1/StrS aminotransferase family protein [Propionivibrio sp.]